MKQAKNQPQSYIFVLIFGIIFLCVGLFYQIPDREIPWDYEEYVGGDAYNIMIEASIRGGEIAGATIAKTIYIVFGFSLLILSILLCIHNKTNTVSTKYQKEIMDNIVESEAQSPQTESLQI